MKPNALGPQSHLQQFRSGRYTVRYVTLRALISLAYGTPEPLDRSEIIGGPNWLSTDYFDVQATAPGTPDDARGFIPRPVRSMVRSLLEDRCALITHTEQREVSVYDVVLAHADGTLGAGLRRRALACVRFDATTPLALSMNKHLTCGGQVQPGRLFATGGTIAELFSGIGFYVPEVDRKVVDRTGLIGTFDVELTWTPATNTTSASAGGPSFFAALQEQLGLKLEARREPVDVLVIDHVERPTQD